MSGNRYADYSWRKTVGICTVCVAGFTLLIHQVWVQQKRENDRIAEEKYKEEQRRIKSIEEAEERIRLETEANHRSLQRAISLADSSLHLEAYDLLIELPDSIIKAEMPRVISGAMSQAIARLDAQKASSIQSHFLYDHKDSSYVGIIEDLESYQEIKSKLEQLNRDKANLISSRRELRELEQRVIESVIRGVIVKKWENNVYECKSLNGNTLFILKTIFTEFKSTGTFVMQAEKTGTEIVELTNGFTKEVSIYTESGIDPYVEIESIRQEIVEINNQISEEKKIIKRLEKELKTAKSTLSRSAMAMDIVIGEKQRREQAALEKQRREQAALEKQRREQAALEKQRREQAALEKQRREQAALEKQRQERQPGRRFKDCKACPEMVVVPTGSFMMGSPSSEEGRDSDEGPQHQVKIGEPVAIGVYEVTFTEWDACRSARGCNGYSPEDRGWGRGQRPVINVSWDDAQAYVRWLSKKTGKQYRLLSEAEWEYVARAGTRTPFHFGRTISTNQANYNRNYRAQTVEAGSFPSNAYGVYDVHGNVDEWVQDCWNDSYFGAPTDGSAWTSGECSGRVLRGGSWASSHRNLHLADRDWSPTNYRSIRTGFRVARSF